MIDDAWTDPNIVNQNFAYGLRDLTELNAKNLSPNVGSAATAMTSPIAPTVSNGGNFGIAGGGTFGGGNATGHNPRGGGQVPE